MKALLEWAGTLAAQRPPAREDVAAFVGSVSDGGADAAAARPAADSLEAAAALCVFLHRSQGLVRGGGGVRTRAQRRSTLRPRPPIYRLLSPS